MTPAEFIKIAKQINKLLGFRGLKHYKRLYNTTIKTWGHPEASMWFVTYYTNDDNEIQSIEVNSTYFRDRVKIASGINSRLAAGESVESILASL